MEHPLHVIGFLLTWDRRGVKQNKWTSIQLFSPISHFISNMFVFPCSLLLPPRIHSMGTWIHNTTIELSHHRIDLEWGEAALGRGITGVCSRYVECDRFYNKFTLRCDGRPSSRFLLSSKFGVQFACRHLSFQGWQMLKVNESFYKCGETMVRSSPKIFRPTSASPTLLTISSPLKTRWRIDF